MGGGGALFFFAGSDARLPCLFCEFEHPFLNRTERRVVIDCAFEGCLRQDSTATCPRSEPPRFPTQGTKLADALGTPHVIAGRPRPRVGPADYRLGGETRRLQLVLASSNDILGWRSATSFPRRDAIEIMLRTAALHLILRASSGPPPARPSIRAGSKAGFGHRHRRDEDDGAGRMLAAHIRAVGVSFAQR